jgi:hypothetical protein
MERRMPLMETTAVMSIVVFVYSAVFYAFGKAGMPSGDASNVVTAITYLGAFALATAILGLLNMAFVWNLNAATRRMDSKNLKRSCFR